MRHYGTTKPAPTPVNQLGRSFERQQKYHPARPYRWWEFRPTAPEAPEVFYPEIDHTALYNPEEYAARQRYRPGFWSEAGAAILVFVFFGSLLLLGWLAGEFLELLLDGL